VICTLVLPMVAELVVAAVVTTTALVARDKCADPVRGDAVRLAGWHVRAVA